jgi:transitional endoplasmic reticulum ATPase
LSVSFDHVQLRVVLHRSPLDARRDVVRVHTAVLDMLGMKAWDPLELRGTRRTAALAAAAPEHTPTSAVLIDDLTCVNAGVSQGDPVTVGRAVVKGGMAVGLSGMPPKPNADPDTLRMALLGKILVAGDKVSLLPQDFARPPEAAGAVLDDTVRNLAAAFGTEWQTVVATVSTTAPSGCVRVTMETQILIDGEAITSGSSTRLGTGGAATTEADLPGLEGQFKRLRELLDLSFNHSDLLERLGTTPQIGVLLTGPPGSGKGALVHAVAGALGVRVSRVWGPHLTRLQTPSALGELEGAFLSASSRGPAVVMIEDVEAIAPRAEPGPLFARLLELTAEAVRTGRVAVVCTTAHPEDTASELGDIGILDQEIAIGLPQPEDRRRMLEVHTRPLPLGPDVDLNDVAARTPGFVAADLVGLCREAALRAAQRTVARGPDSAPFVGRSDFDAALDVVKPSVLHGHEVEVAEVSMEDVGDMERTKQALREAVVWPLRYADTFERLGVEPSSGVLLYGPPGCGKTFLVKALVHEARASFLSVKGAELLSKWVGESERSVRELFRRSRSSAPALVFFDEIDALAPARGAVHDSGSTDRVVAQLLTELDGIEDLNGVFVVGATNRPDLVDPALLRPGRLERLVYVPPPDAAARRAILGAVTKRMPLEAGLDLDALAAGCDGYSAADLDALARAAALIAMREDVSALRVTASHFAAARGEIRPSLRAEQIAALERFGSPR